MITLAVIATAIPLIVYLIIGFLPYSRATSTRDYFIYDQSVSASDYANTSVGYALQMAAIFLFTYWGALYGLGALWTPFFWAIGFYLLIVLLPRFLDYHANGSTMHAYMADTFGGSRLLQRLAATATLIGLLGTMMAEVDYTIQIYTPFIKTEFWQMMLGAAFLTFGLVYIIRNGYKAEVNTERTQIPIAYAALITVILCVLPAVWLHSGPFAYYIVVSLLVGTLLLVLVGKLRLGWRVARKDLQLYIPVVGILAVTFLSAYVRGLVAGNSPSVLSQPVSFQMSAQGLVGLFSLLIANALWMPVDLSTWQRIASVQGNGAPLMRSLRKGTWRVLFESPATWILGAILGICISAGGFLGSSGDASQGLSLFASFIADPYKAQASVLLPRLLYPIFLIASVTIMLSTVHCMISAVSFTAYKDIILSKKTESIKIARLWTILIVIVGMVLYPYLRFHYLASLPTLLYGAYSAQLSLIVVAILSLLRRRLDKRAAIASVLSGFAGTVVSVVLAIRIPDPDAQVLSPLFAVFCAISGYMLFYGKKYSLNNAGMSNKDSD